MKTNRALPKGSFSAPSRLLLGAVLASTLAACGGGSEGAASASPAPLPTVPAAAPAPAPAQVPAPPASVGMQPLAPLSLPINAAVQTLATTNVLAFAIRADGSLWAWGNASMGELGDGERVSRSPEPINIGGQFKSVATGSAQNSIGVKADGTLWGWGLTHPYVLGTGPQNYFPVQIGTDTGFVAVSAGTNNYALKADGTLWAWGSVGHNMLGQLGDGTTVDRLAPVQVGTDFVSVSANGGIGGGVGVKRDGSLWTWGPNRFGTVGDGTTIDRPAPVQIGTGFVAASAGCYHAAALKSDGTLWTWGGSGYGQLGNGSTRDAYQLSPIQVGTGFVSIAAGCTDTFGVRADGAVWAWGGMAAGQLGDGIINAPGGAQGTPFQLPGNFTSFGAGMAHTLAVKADGSLWEWGNVIGMKASEERYPNGYPVQIGAGFK
jgi:alpha-tubulin suppressor-like RCC1 family protein